MKRTNSFKRFLVTNRRLLLFLLLPLCGCVCGLLLYKPLQNSFPQWVALLPLPNMASGISGACSAWFSACFQPLCLLAVLFACGLSVCGAPCAFLAPVFWGVGLGLRQAYYSQSGASGWLMLLAVVLPSAAIQMVALLMGSSESLRMSVLLTAQLLPRSVRCGGLWQVFRLYCVRFLVLLLPVALAGVLEVVIRLLLGR